MSVISGVISRQVLPACGALCIFCPALRTRSRQPVKRYKKLISDIFPRSQVSNIWVYCYFDDLVLYIMLCSIVLLSDLLRWPMQFSILVLFNT